MGTREARYIRVKFALNSCESSYLYQLITQSVWYERRHVYYHIRTLMNIHNGTFADSSIPALYDVLLGSSTFYWYLYDAFDPAITLSLLRESIIRDKAENIRMGTHIARFYSRMRYIESIQVQRDCDINGVRITAGTYEIAVLIVKLMSAYGMNPLRITRAIRYLSATANDELRLFTYARDTLDDMIMCHRQDDLIRGMTACVWGAAFAILESRQYSQWAAIVDPFYKKFVQLRIARRERCEQQPRKQERNIKKLNAMLEELRGV